MNIVNFDYQLAAADADGICKSQTPLAAGDLTIDGALATDGVADLGATRRVLITCAADDSARTFTITGTLTNGTEIGEDMAGSDKSTTESERDYYTVTQVAVDDGTAGAVTVGTSGVGATEWQVPSREMTPTDMSLGVVVGGTVNYTAQYTYDDPLMPPGINQVVPLPTPRNIPAMTSKTTDSDVALTAPVAAWRVQINSGTDPVTVEFIQAGIAGN